MINKILIGFLSSLFLMPKSLFCQIQSGYFYSNYGGILGVGLNPANTSCHANGVDFIIGSAAFEITNNSFKSDAVPLYRNFSIPKTSPFSQKNNDNFFSILSTKFLVKKSIQENGFAFADGTVLLPSFLKKSESKSHAFIWSIKSNTTSAHLPAELALFFYNGAKPSLSILNKPFNTQRFELVSATYLDLGYSYSNKVNKSPNASLRAGISLHALVGINSCFFHDFGSTYTVKSDSIFAIENGHFMYGFAFVDGNSSKSPLKPKGMGASIDLGLIYEKHTSAMPQKKKKNNFNVYGDLPEINPYKYKIGISITDIGALGYKNETRFREMENVNYQYPFIDSLTLSGMFTFDKRVLERLGNSPGTKTQSDIRYTVYLPTRIHIQADFKIREHFYANFLFSQRISIPNTISLHGMNRVTAAARFETKFVEFSIPIGLIEYQIPTIGFSGRVGFFYFGTNSLSELLGLRAIRTMDFYIAVKANIGKMGKGVVLRQ